MKNILVYSLYILEKNIFVNKCKKRMYYEESKSLFF